MKKGRWMKSKNPCGAACAGPRLWRDSAPVLVGRIRLPRDADLSAPKPGSRLIFQPVPLQDVRPGTYARFVGEKFTIWFRIERRLERPVRYVVKVLGVSSDEDVEVAAFEAWDDGNGWVESATTGVAMPAARTLVH
jgi:hypothetical protein